ncbi:MAG: hypothetical protein ACP5HQ_05290 [Thermoprotei archaeon]
MQLLDASPFARALWYLGTSWATKYIDKRTTVTIGRATNLDGYLVEVNAENVVPSPTKLPSGKEIELDASGKLYATYKVAPGVTFERLLELMKAEGAYPALLPTYLKGTVGGFVFTNGCGIGSYKFGFVRYVKPVHELKGEEVVVKASKVANLIEISSESPLAWHAELKDGKFTYYVPETYEDLVSKEAIKKISAFDLINEISSKVFSFIKPEKYVAALRLPFDKFEGFKEKLNVFEEYYAFMINTNSPSKQVAVIGYFPKDRLDDYFAVVRSDPNVKPYLSFREYSSLHMEIMKRYRRETRILVPNEYRQFSNLYLESSKCISCGACIDACKAFSVTKNALYAPPLKFSRVLTRDALEACFACVTDEEACPAGVKISDIVIEMINRIAKEDVAKVEVVPLPPQMKTVEVKLDEKYRNRPPYILFVGCAYKYDPSGVENLLRFFLEEGEKLTRYSPRVKIIDGMCCGFRDFIKGDHEAAQRVVAEIVRQKEVIGASGVYFFCPEGLYVYNRFGGTNGVLVYEAIKDFVNVGEDKIHVGCWGKKLGLPGKVQECAGLGAPSYKGSPVVNEHRDYVTVCPIASWRFLTSSVYQMLKTSGMALTFEEEARKARYEEGSLVSNLVNSVVEAFESVVSNSGDALAPNVRAISTGGYEFFVAIATPLLVSRVIKEVPKYLAKKTEFSEISSYLRDVSRDTARFSNLTSLLTSSLSALNVENLANSLRQSILKSTLLDFNLKPYVQSDEMVTALKRIIKGAITERTTTAILREITTMAP